jgi:hypothetical protein
MNGVAIMVGLAALAAGCVWLYPREGGRRSRQDAERYVLARARGWHYQREGSGDIGYRFSGETDGVAWEMWLDRDRSKGAGSRRPRMIWRTGNLRTAELSLLIIDRRRYDLESGAFGRLAMSAMGEIAGALKGRQVRPQRESFYERAMERDGGNAAFRERFAVLQTFSLPGDWLDEALQTRLQRWPGHGARRSRADASFEASLGPDGLQIEIRGTPTDTAWQSLGELGLALSQRLARASVGSR